MDLEELKREMGAAGEKAFRAKQLYEWMHQKLARDFDEMSNIPKALRERCRKDYSFTALYGYRNQRWTEQRNFCFGCRMGIRWKAYG